MKKLFSGILVCLLLAVSLFTTGCFNLPGLGGDDTGSLLYPSGTIAGYKVCYKPAQYNFERLFLTYSNNIVRDLFAYFTFYDYKKYEYNEETKNYQLITKFPTVTESNYLEVWEEALNIDRIRYQPKFISENEYYTYDDVAWNWSFGDKVDGLVNILTYSETNGQIEKNYLNLVDFLTNIESYSNPNLNDIINIYSTVLEYNIYELVLGRTPTVPVIQISDNATTVLDSVVVTLNGIKVDGSETTRNSLITPIQEEFSLYGTYVGFSERDRENLTNYILETVIGDQIVNNLKYNKNNEYQTKVAEIIENSNPTLNQDVEEGQEPPRDFFDPYPASKIKDTISLDTKKKRLAELNKLVNKYALLNNQKYKNKIVEVLIEAPSDKNGKYMGYTDTMKLVNVDCNSKYLGKIVKVKIESIKTWSMDGVVVNDK